MYNKEVIRGAIRASSLIGEGTSRKVYKLSTGIVVKIAKGHVGYRQNKTEVKVYKSGLFNGLINEVLWYSKDYEYVVTWECQLFKDFFEAMEYFGIGSHKSLLSEEVKRLARYLGLEGSELELINWRNIGLTYEGEFVIIDYGCDKEILEGYK